ncbi:MAG: tetratricopeptide repeat protein [Nitrospirota bacterium]|nr:tetratricopeptide repeat protein [Nitrospirota bacterium]
MLRLAMDRNLHRLALVMLFMVIGLALYGQVILHGEFLFDDFEYIVNNPMIADVLSRGSMSDPRYVGYLSFSLNHAVAGEDPVGFHLFNVLVHIANSLLVFAVAGQLFNILSGFAVPTRMTRQAAFLAALLFLVHPVQTQAVSYITQRFTSLATFFYLLTTWLYLSARIRLERYEGSGRAHAFYALSVLSAVLAMKTKEIAFTIPFMLLLFEALVLNPSKLHHRKRFLYLAPFAAACLIIPLSLLGPDLGISRPDDGIAEVTRAAKLHDLTSYPVLPYFFTQIRVVVVYIRTLLLPVGLRAVYDLPISYTFWDARVIASCMLLLTLAGGAFFLWRKGSAAGKGGESSLAARMIALGIFWFFIALSVESSVIPIKDIIFEHRIYLPSVGFLMAGATLLSHMSERLLRSRGRLLTVGAPVVLLAVPLATGTYVRNEVWTDELKLWQDVVQKSPAKAIGYNNRGVSYAKRGAFESALEDLTKAISFYPKNINERAKWENADLNAENLARVLSSRGDVNIALGNYEQAREDFRKAKQLASMPVDVDSLLRLADGYAKRGAYKHAIEEYNKILQWNPEHIESLNDRANAYSYLGRYDEAVNDFTRIIALDPDFILAYHNRGIALSWTGKSERAIRDFEHACTRGFRPSCESIEVARQGGR